MQTENTHIVHSHIKHFTENSVAMHALLTETCQCSGMEYVSEIMHDLLRETCQSSGEMCAH
jgi:hypothetical protein